jgi:tetratricopeptide (TPR) repeat protein
MPTRSRQHQLEDISRMQFQLVLPQAWVFRDKNKDYGIDGEVELFDTNQKAQGLVFLVQLKATESEDQAQIMNVDLTIETLNYYRTLDLPVLLVRYSNSDKSIFIKWIYSVDLFFAKKNAKNFRIKLKPEDKWSKESPCEIEQRLSTIRRLKSGNFIFPIPVSLDILDEKINTLNRSVLKSGFQKLSEKYSDSINLESKKNDVIANITIQKEELKISFAELFGCSYHNLSLRNVEFFIAELIQDVLIGIAYCMIQFGQIEYCGRIIFENDLGSRLLMKKEMLQYCLPSLFQSSYFEKTLALVSDILDDDNFDQLSLTIYIHVLLNSNSNSPSKRNTIVEFFKQRLKSTILKQNEKDIGKAHYNLGNHLGSTQKKEAIGHYLKAKRFEPMYLQQPYFFNELAGLFFSISKYSVAHLLYSKSLKLNFSIEIKARYADALMFAGHYEYAQKMFTEYIKESEEPEDQFHLKSICLGTLEKKYQLKKQIRLIDKANLLADYQKIPEDQDAVNYFGQALKIDMLCSLAWFNSGIIYNSKNNFDEACFCFIMSSITQPGDIESWRNATILSMQSKTYFNLSTLIIRSAYFYNETEYTSDLYEYWDQQLDQEKSNSFIEMVESILPKKKLENDYPVIRMYNKNGPPENIFNLGKKKENE